MPSYQLRDTATRQLLACGLADYTAAEAAADRLDDELERDLAANGEGAGRIRLRLDIEKVTAGSTEAVGHHVLLLGVDDPADSLPAL
jgi:plasmid stabilization system protein ParE